MLIQIWRYIQINKLLLLYFYIYNNVLITAMGKFNIFLIYYSAVTQ